MIKTILASIPAVLGLCLIAVVGFFSRRAVELVPAKYVAIGTALSQSGDMRGACLHFERAAAMTGEPFTLFNLMNCQLSLGNTEQANRLLQDLAPSHRFGFSPAHLMRASRILSTAKITESELKLAEDQVDRVLENETDNGEALMYRSQILVLRHKPEEAEAVAIEAAKIRPELAINLGIIQENAGKHSLATESFRSAHAYTEKQVSENPQDPHMRLALAESLRRLDRGTEAVTVLEQALRANPQSPVLAHGLASLYVVLSTMQPRHDAKDPSPFSLLISAARLWPQNPDIYRRLSIILETPGQPSEAARKELRQKATSGDLDSGMLLLLGLDAWGRHEANEARLYWERAYSLDPQLSDVANHLAWYWLHAQSPARERALAFVNSALEVRPNFARYLSTRGHIYLSMGKFELARKDFVEALPQLKEEPSLHLGLAAAYRESGAPKMAEDHERLARTLQQRGVNRELAAH